MKGFTAISYAFAIWLICKFKVSNAAGQCILDSQRCFMLVTDPAQKWYSAETYCQKQFYGGFLASIRNAFEMAIIQSIMHNSLLTTDVSIGGFRTENSPFQWTDGEAFFYTNFAPGQPDPSGDPSGDCIQICSKNEFGCQFGKWKTTPCVGIQSSFLCEYVDDSSSTTSFSSSPTVNSSTSSTTLTSSTSPSSTTISVTSTSISSTSLITSTPPPSTTSRKTSTSTTQTTTSTPPPTQTPPYPCQANIIILLDASNGIDPTQFSLQQHFIALTLLDKNWTFSQLAIGAYDDNNPNNFQTIAQFGTIVNYNEAQALIGGAAQYSDSGAPSIATGLNTTLTVFEGQQPGVKQVTIIFASTSDPTDVLAAQPYANQLQALGPVVFVAMGPNVRPSHLVPLASSPDAVVEWSNFYYTVGLAQSILQACGCSPGTHQ